MVVCISQYGIFSLQVFSSTLRFWHAVELVTLAVEVVIKIVIMLMDAQLHCSYYGKLQLRKPIG